MVSESNSNSGNESSTATSDLDSLDNQVKAKHGGKRANSGRKPKNQASTSEATEQDQTPLSEADVLMCKSMLLGGIKLLNQAEKRFIGGSVADIHPQFQKDAKRFEEMVEIAGEDWQYLDVCFDSIARKYQGLSRYAPEVGLALWMIGHAVGTMKVYGEIKKLRIAFETYKGTKGQDAGGTHSNQDTPNG